MSTQSTTTPETGADPYALMSPDELRAELKRLDAALAKQQLFSKQLIEASVDAIKDFSVVILAHIDGNAEGVRNGLEAIVKKNVVVVPKNTELH